MIQPLVYSLLGMTSGSYQRVNLKQQHTQSKGPHHQVLTAVQDVVCGLNEYKKTTCDADIPKELEEYGFEVPERF